MHCPLCAAGARGELDVDALIKNQKTPSQLARYYHMTVDDVMTHVYEHTILELIDESNVPADEPPQGLVSVDFYTTEIMQIMAYLKRYARTLAIHQSSSTKDVELALKLTRELRLTVESLAEFQGRIASKTSTTINIESMNMKLLSLTQIIRTELCPICRQKMLAAIVDLDTSNPPTPTNIVEITSNI